MINYIRLLFIFFGKEEKNISSSGKYIKYIQKCEFDVSVYHVYEYSFYFFKYIFYIFYQRFKENHRKLRMISQVAAIELEPSTCCLWVSRVLPATGRDDPSDSQTLNSGHFLPGAFFTVFLEIHVSKIAYVRRYIF